MTYCVSDIHGYYGQFCRLLDKIKFGGGDRLFVVGDVIDKGPESVRLAKLLFSVPNVTCIAGNHEYDFMKYYRALMRGTEDYDYVLTKLRAYFPDGDLLDWDVADDIDNLPFYAETDDFICVHAGVPLAPDGKLFPLGDVTCEQFVYDRRFKEPNVLPKGGKCVFFGHTPVRYLTGRDEILRYLRPGVDPRSTNVTDYVKVHLDTGVPQGGALGCIAVDDMRPIYVR